MRGDSLISNILSVACTEQGKGAMEYVLKTAMLVAVFFVISDYDDLQKFLVVGSEVRLVHPLAHNLADFECN